MSGRNHLGYQILNIYFNSPYRALMEYQTQLKDLRDKLEQEHMSLLVGAGFSKNVHKAFLNWDELLFDLTKELFKEEINMSFTLQNQSATKTKIPKATFTKKKCKEIIARVGYLEIVTEYIRRKGYPESIATYIEQRTPSIAKDGDNFRLTVGNKSFKIEGNKLSLHRKVIELPWNNIYTTNYDELLERCTNETQVTQLRNEIKKLENENSQFEQKCTELKNKKMPLPTETEPSKIKNAIGPVDLEIDGLVKPLDKNFNQSEEAQETIDFYEKKIRNYEKKIRNNEQTIKENEIALLSRYHVVQNAADLQLKRTKNIIKLHGTLRSQSQKEQFYFEFDSDPHKQYVIAKEDYDDYPKKHEAFTQLMRISLLQESFCLIGFSGVDPNFKAWINWVKDILHKETTKTKPKKYKIYLIDIGFSEIPADQQLFYENHSIVRIPLRMPEVVSFLERETDNQVKISDSFTALKAFLIFLESGESIHPEISQIVLSDQNKRNNIWNNLILTGIPDHQNMITTLNELSDITSKIWIANINYANSYNQHLLINYINNDTYSNYLLEDDEDNTLKKLVLIAFQDQFLPINYLRDNIVNKFLKTEETSADTKTLLSRVSSFNIDKREEQSYYDQLLKLAYSFSFKQLKQKLSNWDPKGKQHIQRSGFMSIYDPKTTAEQLTSIIKDDYILTGEELLYGYELLHFLQSVNAMPINKKIKKTIRNYENAGFQTLRKKFNYLTEQFKGRIQEPIPFGENRSSITRTFSFKNYSSTERALQYLMLLAESGFQLMIQRCYREEAASWYNLFKNGFEIYPYPFLFYSLQYSEENLLKRIGQDYAFSEGNKFKVRNELPNITNKLLKNFSDAPLDYQHHILIFLSKLIIAVDPEVWQNEFLNIWKEVLSKNEAFKEAHQATYLQFFTSSIQFISDSNIISKILIDTLEHIQGEKSEQAISYLFYLNNNEYYRTIEVNNFNNTLKELINKIIDNLSQNRDDLIFVIGNIQVLLTQEQEKRVTEILRNFNFSSIKNPRAWRIFLYFANNNPKIKKAFKKSIIRNKGIWQTNVQNNGYIAGEKNLIELRSLTYSKNIPRGIKWTTNEIKELYDKLKMQIPGIENIIKNHPSSKFDFLGVLDDMYWFLNQFKRKLSDIPEYNETFAIITKLFHINRNYDQLDEGLISNDHSTVIWALSELNRSVYQKTATDAQIKIVLHKVLLQNHPALEDAAEYISMWCKKIFTNKMLKGYAQLYTDILKRFKDNPLTDIDIAFIDEKMLIIADSLKAKGHQDEIISWWISKAQNSVYNNIKQYLKNSANSHENINKR